MRFPAKAEYACLAMRCLAGRPADAPPVRIREIAESESIPETYLVQILQRLKAAGLVRSVRGSAGGYRLARPARSISIAEIMEAVDTSEPEQPSGGSTPEPLARVWREARQAALHVLRRTALEELLPLPQGDWVI
ncbi:MAG: Rrf2 family transcriptional regulator [Isosphaeraceae bacterium]|jgi:Rrf2 family protein|nr:MAG: Rrf2 family transcriptional regulator [Isosphaeraceae bacterium]